MLPMEAGFTWATANPHERARWVRRHRYEPKLNLAHLFCLTEEGLAAIIAGEDWKPEYSTETVGQPDRNGL